MEADGIDSTSNEFVEIPTSVMKEEVRGAEWAKKAPGQPHPTFQAQSYMNSLISKARSDPTFSVPWKQETLQINNLYNGQGQFQPKKVKSKIDSGDYDPIAPGSTRAKGRAIGAPKNGPKTWEGRSILAVRTPSGHVVVVDGHHRAIAEHYKGNKTAKILVVEMPK